MTKRTLISLLIGLNLFLAGVLVLSAYTPPQAFAQVFGRSGEFMLVSAEAETSNDAVYLIDLRNRQMHAFRSTFPRAAGEPTRITLLHTRDLARDFGG